MNKLSPVKVKRKTGEESFLGLPEQHSLTIKDFWQWSASDLVSNATRGILAEYIVAVALGLHRGVRNEWDAYDLKTESGLKVEVKSAAYIQSWHQEELSKISFNIASTQAWDYQTNKYANEKKRQADIYVFCLLHHKDKNTINPMDLSQWRFYIVATKRLNEKYPKSKSIGLSSLKKLDPVECEFSSLKQAIEACVNVVNTSIVVEVKI